MVRYVKGDLLESVADIIAHGCNTIGGFGSGVAGQIANRYPKVRDAYLDKYDSEGWNLGDVQFVPAVWYSVWTCQYIANCATQEAYLPRNKCHADYDAIKTCMKSVRDFAKLHSLTVAIPKIGAGLAGGDWNVIEGILNDVFDDYDVTVYVLE